MKRFTRLVIICLTIFFLIVVCVNLMVLYALPENIDGQYKVEIHRLMNEINQNQMFKQPDLSEYKALRKIEFLSVGAVDSEIEKFYQPDNEESVIQPFFYEMNLKGYVKFTYEAKYTDAMFTTLTIVNGAFAIIFITLTGIFIYLWIHLLKPFETALDMPKRLARGHFTRPVHMAKGRYFEEFLWALDMLRESLETQKKQMQRIDRDRKTLVLSLSHDIKTPLSTIALYIKALEEDLYDAPEKKKMVLNSIKERIQEIEMYMQEMTRGAAENMPGIDVRNSEFYLSDLLKRLQHNYKEKLELLQIGLKIDDCPDAILRGDIDRTLEALENVIENALKYGDGKGIRIEFAHEDNCQLITVSNNGADLPSEEVVHIFEAFWRGSNVKGKSGSGLGLYIARQILLKMDGEIFANVEDDVMQVTLVLNLA